MARKASVKRATKETVISLALTLDGTGKAEISTGIPFFDHMLTLLAMHGFFDLTLKAAGDLEVDFHHTVEDVGIAFGEGVKKALGDRTGIRRYGAALVPMDEALARVVLDISGRPYLGYRVKARGKVKDFNLELVESFFKAVADNAGITLHIELLYGTNRHHIVEAIFKGFGRALDEATRLDKRRAGVPSTKGTL
ncbi:MAG: imidazoleglycerol-phosphate dehydratase [Deltaproteobacteria bacterium RBG_16_54_18]|nr:MAG: imidazoleglycerol-phosphate dehydratase [Deltaproteobacteria bacterium RBG_16_54_18]